MFLLKCCTHFLKSVQLCLCLCLQSDLPCLLWRLPDCQHQVGWRHHHLPLCSSAWPSSMKFSVKLPYVAMAPYVLCVQMHPRGLLLLLLVIHCSLIFPPLYCWFWYLCGNLHCEKGHGKNIENIHLLLKGRAQSKILEVKNNLEKIHSEEWSSDSQIEFVFEVSPERTVVRNLAHLILEYHVLMFIICLTWFCNLET